MLDVHFDLGGSMPDLIKTPTAAELATRLRGLVKDAREANKAGLKCLAQLLIVQTIETHAASGSEQELLDWIGEAENQIWISREVSPLMATTIEGLGLQPDGLDDLAEILTDTLYEVTGLVPGTENVPFMIAYVVDEGGPIQFRDFQRSFE